MRLLLARQNFMHSKFHFLTPPEINWWKKNTARTYKKTDVKKGLIIVCNNVGVIIRRCAHLMSRNYVSGPRWCFHGDVYGAKLLREYPPSSNKWRCSFYLILTDFKADVCWVFLHLNLFVRRWMDEMKKKSSSLRQTPRFVIATDQLSTVGVRKFCNYRKVQKEN